MITKVLNRPPNLVHFSGLRCKKGGYASNSAFSFT